jgi:polyisoprenyl-phosphate glycosyltransferase
MQSAAELLIPRRQPALLSIVIPLYNEQEMVPLLRRHLQSILEKSPCPWELILVNDGSSDGTLAALRQWAAEEPNVVALALSRNFGHQAAATAGLDVASGDAIVLMDADLQDPPELVFEMLAKYIEGYDVVYAQRRERLGESWFKRHSAWLFYRMMRLAIDKRLPPDTGDYRLISRQCLDALRQMREQHRFLRGMVAWVGFPQTAVRFVRQPRAAGESKYPLRGPVFLPYAASRSFLSKLSRRPHRACRRWVLPHRLAHGSPRRAGLDFDHGHPVPHRRMHSLEHRRRWRVCGQDLRRIERKAALHCRSRTQHR